MTQSRHESPDLDRKPSQSVQFPTANSDEALDEEGIPISSPVSEWLDLSAPLDSRRLQAILRLSRADGSVVFGPLGRSAARLNRLDLAASQVGDPSLAGVVARWLPRGRSSTFPGSPPPLPSDIRQDRPLAVLRADWSPKSDLLAIDHREVGPKSLVEVASKGQVWLGPTWTSSLAEGKASRPKPLSWTSTPFVQSLEWSFSVGGSRIIRSITLLRGRSMALLGEQLSGPGGTAEIRLAIAEGVEASFIPGSRAVLLGSGPGKPTARILPLGLPDHDRPTDPGSIAIEGRQIVIRQNGNGRKVWMPVLITWDRPPRHWRQLTVAARSRTVPSDQAFACRVGRGSKEPGLVIYRSLGPPTLRSFLGYQTSSRFLVGNFSRTGEVSPILKIDG